MTASPRYDAARRAANVVIVAGFAIGIAAPLVRQWTGGSSGGAGAEYRLAGRAPRVRWNVAALSAYPRLFESWYADAFGFRTSLVRWHHIVRWFGFRVSPTDKVVLGDDEWLFYAEDRSLEVYRGVAPLRDDELAAWQRLLEERRDLLARIGARYLYVIAPNKNQIYSEHVPGRFERLGPTRLDQLVGYLREHSDFRILDLRPDLLAAKRGDEPAHYLYNRLGTHWNARGYLVAYLALAGELAALMPRFVPLAAKQFRILPGSDDRDSWGGRMYMEDLLYEEEQRLVAEGAAQIEILPGPHGLGPSEAVRMRGPDLDAPRASIFHDSYLLGLRRTFARHFSEVSYYERPFDLEWIAGDRADVVVEAYVERYLVTRSPYAALPMEQDRLGREFDASETIVYQGKSQGRRGRRTWGLAPFGEARLIPVESDLAVQIRPGAGVLLPELPAREGRLVLRIVLVAPSDTELELCYKSRERPEFNRTDVVRRRIKKGRNVLFIELADPTLHGRILIRPGTARGRYFFADLTLRVVP